MLPVVALTSLLWPCPASLAAEAAAPAPEAEKGSENVKPGGSTQAGGGQKGVSSTADAVADTAAMALFLDRLMLAESGGRDTARNPRSTAVGPFQFIESTFLSIVRRHFPAETDALSPSEVLKLRTNRAFARRAAEAFTRDNAALLASEGFDASFANLRLAHLVGPGGAARVLKAPAETPAATVLGRQVARTNPFLVRMTNGDLIRWSAKNLAASALANAKIAADPSRVSGWGNTPPKPAIRVRCNRALASCRRWIKLAEDRLARKQRLAGTKRDR